LRQLRTLRIGARRSFGDRFEAFFGLLTFDIDADSLRLVGQVRRLHLLSRGSGRVPDAVGVQEAGHDRGLDGEVDVLGDVAVGGDHQLERVQLRGHDADEIPALIEQRAAGVPGLYRRRNLKVPAVLAGMPPSS
jgi:hypothetical protein